MTNRQYVAYGSNLNDDDWRDWCKRNGHNPASIKPIKPIGVCYLPDLELVFDYHSTGRKGGALNLKPRIGQMVAGVRFEVTKEGWKALDAKEGHSKNYERFDTVALLTDGEQIPVTTYRVCADKRRVYVKPHPDYLNVVRAGLKAYGLSEFMLDAAAVDKDPGITTDAVFVYGTLMRGESRFSRLSAHGLTCALLAEMPGRLRDLGAYPGLLPPTGPDDWVEGEFIRVRDIGQAIADLDVIEGFRGFGQPGSLYRRALVEVGVGDGRTRYAWTYFLAEEHANAPIIPSRSWRASHGRHDTFVERLVAAYADGDERRLAAAVSDQDPFACQGGPTPPEQGEPLADAVRRGTLSERQLARATGRWAVVP